ncbi:MAG: toll/interleukin-1 receptor domain-containing protein [Sphingomicrobium sp.]
MSLEGQVSERRSGSSTVFLSYAHEDQACAQKIVKALEAQGFSIWWDGLISGGHDFAERIEQALATSDAIVVLWSKTSIHSHWVRDEASIGRERQCLVPLSIDGSEPPLGFRQIQSIDFNK